MPSRKTPPRKRTPASRNGSGEQYILEEQIGYLLRVAMQRHKAIFTSMIASDLTQTQFATLAKLAQNGPVSQNLLGRLIALDAPTIKGVIDRLRRRGLVVSRSDAADTRLRLITLTAKGEAVARASVAVGKDITDATLEPLAKHERDLLKLFLQRLA